LSSEPRTARSLGEGAAPEANAELQQACAELRNEQDTAPAELQARTTALAQPNSEYDERIKHQSAAIDVLKAMSPRRAVLGPCSIG
jgi:hypothetical protein